MAIHIASSPYRSAFQPQGTSRQRSFSRIEYSGAAKSFGSFFQTLKQNGHKERLRFSVGPMALIVGMGLFAIGISVLYLMNFNKVATIGYDLKRVERDHQELVDQYEIQNMKLAELASLTNISKTDKVESMRYPRSITFVRANTALASR